MPQTIDTLNAALQGRYRLDRELGRGGMATVYLARDLRHGRSVALKVMDSTISAEIGSQRFENEVRTTARLNHPHILPLFDSGEAAGHLFYVMPVVEGEALDRRLAREERVPTEEAVRIVVNVARALGHAHRQGVVHRDIKPSNILLHHGESMVADFGVSIVTGADTRLTADGLSVGTPDYMSPEQVGGDGTPDGRADQYALACVLFEMLRGEPPFPRGSAMAVAAAHLVDPPPGLALEGAVGKALDGVLGRALSKEPGARFPSIEDFAAAVEEALVRGTASASTSAGEASEDSGPPGLVVLPFDNLSPDPENEYFSDGLTEEVIADLSQIRALRVISRTSAMRLKGTTKDLPTLGRELGVRYVLEGGVRKAGNDLRITARLIEAATEETLWSERFSGTLDDVFEIQEQVARAIAEALRVRISPAEKEALAQRPIADPRAYEAYLRARHEAWRFSPEGLERATGFLETALEIAGENELLLGTLGHVIAMHAESGIGAGPENLARLSDLASRVFALNPDAARGHWIRMFLAFQAGDMAEAITSGHRALAADPDDPDTRILLAYVLANVGRTQEASRILEPALASDPLTPVTQLMPGFIAVLEGRNEDALEPYRRAWELDPESPFTGVFYGWALGYAGREAQAVPFLDRVADEHGDGPFGSWARVLARALEGDAEGVRNAMSPAFEAAGRSSQTFARAVADGWALVGDADRAVEWLDRAVELGLLAEEFLREHARFLDPVRSDSRLGEVLEKVRQRRAALPGG